MSFAKSEALFPAGELAGVIATEYERQCRALCCGPFPSSDEVQARFNQLRPLL
jgi:hypothetical protein